jgi:hypothetical protein
MQELRDYYGARLKAWIGVIVALAILYQTSAVPKLNNLTKGMVSAGSPTHHILAVILRFLVKNGSSLIVGGMYLFGEAFIRTTLWKLERPHLNFSGSWRAETTYTTVEKETTAVTAKGFQSFASSHDVRIAQDCLSISIEPTARAFASWQSIAMTILEQGGIGYAYRVSYDNSQDPDFPPDAIGYEELSVIDSRRLKFPFWREAPHALSGTFAHCARGAAPIFRGTVKFWRKP